MKAFLTFQGVLLLFILIRSVDLAISSAIAGSVGRAIAYGLVAAFTRFIVLFSLLGV